MIKKSAVLTGNDEFWHSAIIDCSKSSSSADDSSTSSSSSGNSCDKQAVTAADGMPEAHHQLLLDDVPSYKCLTGYDHRGDDTAASLFFEEGNSSSYDDDDDEVPMSSCCRQEKMSSVKKRGGGSWFLRFARLQSRSTVNDEVYGDDDEDEQHQQSPSKTAASVELDAPPGLVRTNSVSDFSLASSEEDDSTTSSSSASSKNKKKTVGFNCTVKIQHIPHSSTYSPCQRRKMYSSSFEVRKNKIRNKKEYRYDGYDWRNVTEEWEMSVDMVTGELIHPVHTSSV